MEPVGFLGIFEESRRIISAHTRHFLGLSVLFLLPLSFLSCAASTFRNWIDINESHEELLSQSLTLDREGFEILHASSREVRVSLFLMLYSLLMLLLSLCSNSAVTHSTCNGFFGRGVKLPGALKSIPGSAWRLLLTLVSAGLVLAGIALSLCFILLLVLFVPSAFHVNVENFATPVYGVTWVLSALVGLYLQVHWILVSVVSVIEGSWGLKALKRSAYLVKGLKSVSLSLSLFFALTGFVLALWARYLQSSASDSLDLLSKIVQSITVLGAMTIWFLYNIATNTVLYMYCKAHHNELLDAIVEDFAQDYVALSFDYQKVPQLVSVAEP